MQCAWDQDVHVVNPFLRLHIKLKRTSKALKMWAKSKLGRNKVLRCAAEQLIGVLDVVQDFRQLSEEEIQLKKDLKVRLLGLLAAEKLRAKPASRLSHIRAAEANSANARRKNQIFSLQANDQVCSTHEQKEGLLFNYFSSHFGRPAPRIQTFNWELLGLPSCDLRHLEDVFTEEEVRLVIADIAAEKAPGPDGFIGVFLKSSWP